MKIALISDIHFGKNSRTDEFSVPGEPIDEKTAGGISLKKGLLELLKSEDVKYIFLAGDLTSRGTPQEYYYCERFLLELAENLNLPQDHIVCAAGNHDIDRNISTISNSFENSNEDVKKIIVRKYQNIAANASCLNLDKIPVLSDGVAPFSGIYEADEFIVFVLNSSILCSHSQDIPHGKVTTEQLDWFKDSCKKYENDKRTKILLMHHHPINYPYPYPSLDVSAIEEGSELINICGNNGINIVMHGHRHHPTAVTKNESGWKNPITFICAGSLSVNAQQRANGEIPNTVHIIDLQDAPEKILLYNYKYTSAEGWFPINSSTPQAPLSKQMYLGKIYSDQEISEALKIFDVDKQLFSWEELPEELKFMNVDKLNDIIKDRQGNKIISGKFPDEKVFISTLEGIQ